MALQLSSSHPEVSEGVFKLKLPHLGAGDSRSVSRTLVSISIDVYKEFKPLPLKASSLIYTRLLLTEPAPLPPCKSRITFSTTISSRNVERINEFLFTNPVQIG